MVRSTAIRQLTRSLPFVSGHKMRALLDRWEHAIVYPTSPVVVRTRSRGVRIEIRDCREFIQRNIYFLGYWEIRETSLIKRLLRPGDTFVDVGANLGWFSLVAARRVGPSGRVLAFEPSPALLDHLKANLQLNGFTNVTAEQLAVSDQRGHAILTACSDRNSGTARLLDIEGGITDRSMQVVSTVSLDEYLSDSGQDPIRLMKVDVEGAEMKVMAGARKTLQQRLCTYLLIEVWDSALRGSGSSSRELLQFLNECGYDLFRVGMLKREPIKADDPIVFGNVLARARSSLPATPFRPHSNPGTTAPA